jgi:hypothetical protein
MSILCQKQEHMFANPSAWLLDEGDKACDNEAMQV